MSYLLGFGIPIVDILIGLFASRAVYRSRHKRKPGYAFEWDEDSTFLAFLTFLLWPVFVPVYFTKVSLDNVDGGGLLRRFYDHNMPESNRDKELRLRHERADMQAKIRRLEKELGMKPSKPDYECHGLCV